MALIYLGYKALKKKMGDGEEEPELTEVSFQKDFSHSDWLARPSLKSSDSDGYIAPSSQYHFPFSGRENGTASKACRSIKSYL